MSVFVLGMGLSTPRDLEVDATSETESPDFRRATLGMKLSYLACQRAMATVPPNVSRANVAIVVGTSFGELQATYTFFSGLSLEKVPRPLAFQNSLHHSTLGFLSRLLNLTGIGFTVSHEFLSGEDALDLAGTLLDFDTEYVLVVGVDCVVDELRLPMQRRIQTTRYLTSGSGALLLSNRDDGSRIEITAMDIARNPVSPPAAVLAGDFYDSDCIAHIASFLQTPGHANQLVLPKPDGTTSTFFFKTRHV